MEHDEVTASELDEVRQTLRDLIVWLEKVDKELKKLQPPVTPDEFEAAVAAAGDPPSSAFDGKRFIGMYPSGRRGCRALKLAWPKHPEETE